MFRFLSLVASMTLLSAYPADAATEPEPVPSTAPSADLVPAGTRPLPSASFTPAPGTQTILVPAGTQVPFHVVGSLSSGSAKAGDVFQIQCADDVVVGGMVVIRKGAGGQGTVVDADGAGGNGHSGSLSFTMNYIYAIDGGKVRLSEAAQKQSEEDRKGASSTATIIGFATFGLGGLFGHNLAHGRQKVLDEKTILQAFVADNVHVDSSLASRDRYDK